MYVGETSQTLRKRLNNHRNRLKQLCGLYLYQHFNSDGHTIDDLNIMPIEEVTLTPTDKIKFEFKENRKGSFLVQGTLHNLSLWPK